jgi:hypothetical protein
VIEHLAEQEFLCSIFAYLRAHTYGPREYGAITISVYCNKNLWNYAAVIDEAKAAPTAAIEESSESDEDDDSF